MSVRFGAIPSLSIGRAGAWGGPGTPASAPVCEIQTDATTRFLLLDLQITFTNNNLSSSQIAFGLGFSATAGIGLSSASPQVENTGLTDVLPGVNIWSSWSQPPTVPANFFRRFTYTAGALQRSFLLDFPNGIKVQPSSSLSFWTAGAPTNLGTGVCIELNVIGDG